MYASNTAEILAAIQTLFPEGSLIELRIPRKSGTIVGYFKDQQALADAITKYSGKVPAVYYTLNVPTPDFYTVYPDRVVPQKATADCQIVRRQWLLIDCDPVRFGADGLPLKDQKVSSTDSEKQTALDTAKKILQYLTNLGWATPLTADSGNGFHLLYRLDLPNTKEVTQIIKAVLDKLAERFDTEFVKVDTTVYNASRITKAYGSMACKGAATEDRPHRKSCLRNTTGGKVPVTLERLQAGQPQPEQRAQSAQHPAPTKKTGCIIKEESYDWVRNWRAGDYAGKGRRVFGVLRSTT